MTTTLSALAPKTTGATAPRRIAVIGAGISGMGAAYFLSEDNDVVLFEQENRLGGHARTRMVGRRGDQPVDTGFIVFNQANYPNLVSLFDDLSVPVVKSKMTFGASFGAGRLEYGLASVDALFAQRRNAANPAFLRMVRDILRFNRHAVATVADDHGLTIGGLMDRLCLGRYFRDRYLLPFSGAIWSTPTQKILDFPAHAMVRFFQNHGLLGVYGQHQWYTVEGGSVEYVSRMGSAMAQRGVQIRLGGGVTAVRRTAEGTEVKARGGTWERFDEVVFATHSDQALALLSDATPAEAGALGAIRYQANRAVLHSDGSVMPRSGKVWSSWVYSEAADRDTDDIDLTYWMNSLQPWLTGEPLFVTLNSQREIDPGLIWDEVSFAHPVYDIAALAAQKAIATMNGANATWFCGAWMKNGFHEDGLSSALDVARALGAPALAVAAE